MPTITLPYKHDPSAGGPIPAHIHYSTTTSSSTPTPKPIILIFHAGGFAAGSTNLIPQSQITHLTDTLNAVAIAPEYRLCPQASLRAGPVADAHACLAWARETLPRALAAATGGAVLADPARVGVMGHSAGGMLALELVSIRPSLLRERESGSEVLMRCRAMRKARPAPSSISTG